MYVYFQKQNIEIKQIKQSQSDELSKLNSSVQLSLNLEKARTTEAVSRYQILHQTVFENSKVIMTENAKQKILMIYSENKISEIFN